MEMGDRQGTEGASWSGSDLGKGTRRFLSFRGAIRLLPTIPVVEAFRRHLTELLKDTYEAKVRWDTHPQTFDEWLETYPTPELMVEQLEFSPLDWTNPTMPTILIRNADNAGEHKIHAMGWRAHDDRNDLWPSRDKWGRVWVMM